MIARECLSRRDLAAFVDGELRGSRVLRVLQHLDACPACTSQATELRALGDAIRLAAPSDLPPSALDGLAGTVVSRTKAEAAQSWEGVFWRAQEDLHWMVVGAGAVAATLVSTLVLSAILAFGPKPDRQDSLSAVITNFRSPAGTLFVLVTPVGPDQEPVLVQVDDGGPVVSSATLEFASRLADRSPSEVELVDALQAAVTDRGRTMALNMMDPERRRHTESLLQDINRLRSAGPLPRGATVNVHEVRLATSVTVRGRL